MTKKRTEKTAFPVLNMGCASCAARVEKTLNSLDEVVAASVNYAASTATVEYDARISPRRLREAVQEAGYDLLIDTREDILGELNRRTRRNTES